LYFFPPEYILFYLGFVVIFIEFNKPYSMRLGLETEVYLILIQFWSLGFQMGFVVRSKTSKILTELQFFSCRRKLLYRRRD
jgi:hypothetical protein